MDLPSNADAPGGPTPSPGSGSRPTGVAEANCSPVGIGWGAIEGGDHLCARLFDQASQPLVLFDEILRKGFDGHNFIVGLSEHLRNLLVSQDARTTNLMEVPESVKKKYALQAQSAPPSLLLTWLNIGSVCDINYKASKNQRLAVELALMKMANVGAILQLQETEYQPESLKKKVV